MANEKRLIDANALIEILEEIAETDESMYFHLDEITQEIFDTPTVEAVEVVRCKDCEYYEIGKDYLPYCNHCDGGIADYPREYDFCSYGERRTT